MQAVEVGPQLGRGERAVLGGEGEVEGGQHGPLEVQVEDALGVLGGPLRQLGDAPGAGQGLVEHLVVGAHVVDQADLRRPAAAGMRSPVSAYSLASWRLVSSGQVTGPPSAATRPTSTCGSARWALSAM